MASNPDFMDGELEYGTPILTVTPKSGANPVRSILTPFDAIAVSDFSFSDDSKEVDQTDQYGVYAGGFGIAQKRQGSTSVQLPSGRRLYPGDTFVIDTTANDRVTAGTTLFQVSKASHPYSKENWRQQDISYFIRKYALNNTDLNTPAPS